MKSTNRTSRTSGLLAICLVTALIGPGGSPSASAADSPCYSHEAPSDPTIDPKSDVFLSDDGQKALDLVGRQVHDESSAIGAFLDHDQANYVVVLSADAAVDAGSEINSLEAPFNITVVRSCSSLTSLENELKTVVEGEWTGNHEAAYSVWIDPARGQLAIDTSSESMANEAVKVFPQAAVAVVPEMSRASRVSDSAPHIGGAHISHTYPNGTYHCSSGFAVLKDNGNRKMLTAGHCFGVGDSVNNDGGSFGVVKDRVFPERDLEIMDDSTYTDNVYSDPGGSAERDITGAANPNVGINVCQSGYSSLETCGIEVKNTNITFCDGNPSQCTSNLVRAYLDGVAVRSGDSGGPVYTTPTPGTAHIRGMVVAMLGYDTLVFHKVSSVENEFNCTVLTSD